MITVIIPHLNQADALRKCLTSLTAQGPQAAGVEIIVVDNGSTIPPTDVCAAFPGTRLLTQPEPGPGPARNVGAAEAKGQVLAFIDADCVAAEDWLSVIEATLSGHSGHVAIGGNVLCEYASTDRFDYAEPFERIYAFRNRMYVEQRQFSVTCNMAMRRETFAHVGPFGGLNVAEDRDWGERAAARGVQWRYVDGMVVHHPARRHFADLTRKWDRMIRHDYTEVGSPADKAKWVLKAVALFLSPLAEIPAVLTSDKVSGPSARWTAFSCLVRIRLHRSRRMLSLIMTGNADGLTQAWNRSA